MTRPHFHASVNVPGYVPEGDVEIFTSKRAAAAYVALLAREYRAYERDVPRAEQRRTQGSAASGSIHLERLRDPHDLGITIWWLACRESDCTADS